MGAIYIYIVNYNIKTVEENASQIILALAIDFQLNLLGIKQGYTLLIGTYIVNLTAALSEPSKCVKLPVHTCLKQCETKPIQLLELIERTRN